MACSPQFAESIPFECVMEIISDIRNPSENWMDLLEKAAWVLGSCVSVLGKKQVYGTHTQHKVGIKTLANKVEAGLMQHSTKGVYGLEIDPALIMMIIQLILKWLSSRK